MSGSPRRTDEEPWWAEGLRFTCTRCGRCCQGPDPGFVKVGEGEIARLAEALGLSAEAFGRRYLRRTVEGHVSLTEHPNRDCIFWSRETQGCQVYEARPEQCRTFPFWPELLDDRAQWDEWAETCPGMNHGRRYARGRIESILAGQAETRPGRKRPPRRLPSSSS